MAGLDPRSGLVLLTGAAGSLGTVLRTALAPRWRLRLLDRAPIAALRGNEEAVQADIADRAAVALAMEGVAALVHFAGAPDAHDLESLFHANVRGVFDVFEAARLAGVRRIVFASSNHAHGCWPVIERVTPQHPARPDSLYGAFKVMGEAMLRFYFDRHAMRSVSLRIGTCRQLPIDQRSLATWLSFPDLVQLVERSLLHDDPGCLVVNAYSANTRLRIADPNWAFLGYEPKDDAEEHLAMLRAMGVDVDGPWEWPEHGGAFARWPGPPPGREG